MKIQFEIKEKLPEIIAEIMHSDKWQTKILEKMHGLERITIKDPNYKSEACIEIWWEDDQGEMAVSASVGSDPDDPVYAISGKQQ